MINQNKLFFYPFSTIQGYYSEAIEGLFLTNNLECVDFILNNYNLNYINSSFFRMKNDNYGSVGYFWIEYGNKKEILNATSEDFFLDLINLIKFSKLEYQMEYINKDKYSKLVYDVNTMCEIAIVLTPLLPDINRWLDLDRVKAEYYSKHTNLIKYLSSLMNFTFGPKIFVSNIKLALRVRHGELFSEEMNILKQKLNEKYKHLNFHFIKYGKDYGSRIEFTLRYPIPAEDLVRNIAKIIYYLNSIALNISPLLRAEIGVEFWVREIELFLFGYENKLGEIYNFWESFINIGEGHYKFEDVENLNNINRFFCEIDLFYKDFIKMWESFLIFISVSQSND